MKRLLFFAEAVTLAHLARPLAYLKTLDPTEWEIHLACPQNRFRRFLGDFPHPVHTLESISPQQFQHALDWGKPLYSEKVLARYIEEDLALIGKVKPDRVMGDLRLSLSISARVAGVPYVNLTNAYWRPEYAPIPPMPVLKPLARLPRPLVKPLFNRLVRRAFAAHARPFNRLRQNHGLPPLPGDVRFFYTDGDEVLYADHPAHFPRLEPPEHHHFLGPLLWAPPVEDPPWWPDLPTGRPIIYLAVGSTGNPRIFRAIVDALKNQSVTLIAAMGGKAPDVRGNLYHAPYLDGLRACQRARLMIGNGGIMSCHQAVAAGIPVIGLCSNMDQMLSMQVMEENGLGWRLAARPGAPRMVRSLLQAHFHF